MLRRSRKGLCLLACLTVAGVPLVPAHAAGSRPNPVIVWDQNAQTAIWDVARQQPQFTSRSYAMVNGAVYDAVNAIAGTPYQPYLIAPPANGHESTDAAVATAAFLVLKALFPAQEERLRAQYDEALAAIPDGAAERGGVAVGTRTATAMIAARRDDGAFGDQTWPIGTEPGQWRPTPPGFTFDGAWVGQVKPFLLPSASMFRTSGPPALTSRQYARDFDEVKAVGAADSTVRTADQTQAAIWWHDRRLTDWEIKRQLATAQRLSPLRTARLFALMDLAGADTATACFNEKLAWNRWRPITAIQLAATDGNPDTAPDPSWTPLLGTPPHPDYTSGHTCATGAHMAVLRSFFGRDDLSFSAYSADAGATRHFRGFSHALAEVIEARIWGGIHTRSADVAGARLGKQVATYAVTHYLRPKRP
jgi:PAP2 superfamily